MRKDPGSYLDHRFRTRNHMVWGQPLQEIHRKPRNLWQKKNLRKIQKIKRFMHSQYRKYKENYCFLTDRFNQAKPERGHPGGDLCSGFKFIYDKRLGPLGAFLRPGGSKNAKNFESRAKNYRRLSKAFRSDVLVIFPSPFCLQALAFLRLCRCNQLQLW